MLISILLPTYRRPHQLREALASLAEQERRLIGEILVGDDSPTSLRPANQAEIAASKVASLVRYIPNDPPKGNYPNQWALAEQARFDHILILHDDDQLCPGGLTLLADARAAEVDDRVGIWFGRDLIMDERGQVDPERSRANARHYGKDGAGCAQPVWQWCLTQSIPPNCALLDRPTYLRQMRGERDGSSGDWGLSVRLANSGRWGRFIAKNVSRYRVQPESLTNAGRGVDAHCMYELTQQLRVPEQGEGGKERLLQRFAEVATTRYLRDGDRVRAWQCFTSRHWRWRRRLSPRGVATLAMLLTPSALWRWSLHYRA